MSIHSFEDSDSRILQIIRELKGNDDHTSNIYKLLEKHTERPEHLLRSPLLKYTDVHKIPLNASEAEWFKGACYVLVPNILYVMRPGSSVSLDDPRQDVQYNEKFHRLHDADIKTFYLCAKLLNEQNISNQSKQKIINEIHSGSPTENIDSDLVKIMNNIKHLINIVIMCKIIIENIDHKDHKFNGTSVDYDIKSFKGDIETLHYYAKTLMFNSIIESFWQYFHSGNKDQAFYLKKVFQDISDNASATMNLNGLIKVLESSGLQNSYLKEKLITFVQALQAKDESLLSRLGLTSVEVPWHEEAERSLSSKNQNKKEKSEDKKQNDIEESSKKIIDPDQNPFNTPITPAMFSIDDRSEERIILNIKENAEKFMLYEMLYLATKDNFELNTRPQKDYFQNYLIYIVEQLLKIKNSQDKPNYEQIIPKLIITYPWIKGEFFSPKFKSSDSQLTVIQITNEILENTYTFDENQINFLDKKLEMFEQQIAPENEKYKPAIESAFKEMLSPNESPESEYSDSDELSDSDEVSDDSEYSDSDEPSDNEEPADSSPSSPESESRKSPLILSTGTPKRPVSSEKEKENDRSTDKKKPR